MTREFAVIDPAEGVLFRASCFDDALLQEEGSEVVGVLTLTQVPVVLEVVRRLNDGLSSSSQYHAGFLPDHRIAPIGENGLVSRGLFRVAVVAGIVTAKASLTQFREEYLGQIEGQSPIAAGKLLAA